ncbi:MAG TPA: phosphatase PAP2 family protein [Candidatus Absconditabacterales bacterium]|nr:phosphatase PAP2 family protein [Candidatus Absconditabacterales bacterium]
MFTIIEPVWGQHSMSRLNHIVSSDTLLFTITAFCSDFFVFPFPIILVALFLYGIMNKHFRTETYALKIVFSTSTAMIITLLIQQVITKARPETLPGLQLILHHLPTMSFPSDHATVSMAFAIGFWLSYRDFFKKTIPLSKIHPQIIKWVKMGSILLFCSALLMGICRTAVAVHRPTDIIAGRIIGIMGGRLGYQLSDTRFGQRAIDLCINIAKKIVSKK